MVAFWEKDKQVKQVSSASFWAKDARVSDDTISGLPQRLQGMVDNIRATPGPTISQTFEGVPEDERSGVSALRAGAPEINRQLNAGARSFANMATFGQGDKFAAGMGALTGVSGQRGDYAGNIGAQSQESAAAREQYPVVSAAGGFAGALANPANRLVGAGVTKILPSTGILSRYANAALQGSILGTGYGAGFAAPGQVMEGALHGAKVGLATGLAARAVGDIAGAVVKKLSPPVPGQAAPTLKEIKDQSQAAYKTSEQAGVVISPQSFTKFTSELPADLKALGYHPKVTPGTRNVIEALQDEAAQGPITLETLDKMRSIASGASVSRDANEARLAGIIVRRIDNYIDKLSAGDLLAGEAGAKDAIDALQSARALWRIKAKLQNISDIVDTGEALNDPNWVKNRFRMIVRKPAEFNKYTAEEQEIIKQVARTGRIETIARLVPWRAVQTASPFASELGQNLKLNSLQDLIARGGAAPPSTSPLLGAGSIPALAGFANYPFPGTRAVQANGRR